VARLSLAVAHRGDRRGIRGVMADVNFRGVVLSSCWRLAHRIFTIPSDAVPGKPWKKATPDIVNYIPQPWATEPLIRQALLYFDQIVLPVNDVLPLPAIPDIEYLVDAGAIELKTVPLNFPTEGVDPERFQAFLEMVRQLSQIPGLAGGGRTGPGQIHVAEYVAAAHRQAFVDLDRAQRGAWSFATVGQGMDFANDQSAAGYQLDLIDCLPYPHSTASYERIISFKRTHGGALIDLRGALDEVHDGIRKSGDPAAIASIEFERLQVAMRALIEHAGRTRLEHFLGRVTIERSFEQWVLATLAGGAISEKLQGHGWPFPLPLLAGVALAARGVIRIAENKCPVNAAYTYVHEGLQDGIMSKRPTVPGGQA
jgi:hypothetical protein